jgi:hypothetical protein
MLGGFAWSVALASVFVILSLFAQHHCFCIIQLGFLLLEKVLHKVREMTREIDRGDVFTREIDICIEVRSRL